MDHPSVVAILVHGGEGPVPSACLQRALQILTTQKLMFQNDPESSQLIAGTGQKPMSEETSYQGLLQKHKKEQKRALLAAGKS